MANILYTVNIYLRKENQGNVPESVSQRDGAGGGDADEDRGEREKKYEKKIKAQSLIDGKQLQGIPEIEDFCFYLDKTDF